MLPALELGVLLRQRYSIKQILGQGGFGRTYLALDQERFNECCVLKEFVVQSADLGLMAKGKSLFQREASILYQVNHPQIPRFWAAFESDQRLYLVQDYVAGPTYRGLLKARSARRQTLTEPEVLHLLTHLLPVLGYLHDRQIVHRDISPDNLILRPVDWPLPTPGLDAALKARAEHDLMSDLTPDLASDLTVGVPMLLDFGAVKAATSRWQATGLPATRVGKLGYAPPEQLQTGSAEPHSDLYALAATCLVLLTGREPHQLIDGLTLDWHWRPFANISNGLVCLLERMLALHPADRYPSAAAVQADLQALVSDAQRPPRLHRPARLETADRTLAAGYSAPTSLASTSLASTSLASTSLTPAHLPRSAASREPAVTAILERPAAPRKTPYSLQNYLTPRVAMGASLTVICSVGLVLFRAPLPSSHQAIIAPAAPVSTAPATGEPQELRFAAGEISLIKQGNLQDNQTQVYTLRAAKGQIMTAMLEGPGVVMTLKQSTGQSIDTAAQQTRSWTGQLPLSDQYRVEISGSGSYSLDVAITPVSRSALTQRLKLETNRRTTVNADVGPGSSRRYLVKAQAGQSLGLKILQGTVSAKVLGPRGNPLGSTDDDTQEWRGKLPKEGDYVVEVTSAPAPVPIDEQDKPTGVVTPQDYTLALELK
jgi:serine/threonine protein kinase